VSGLSFEKRKPPTASEPFYFLINTKKMQYIFRLLEKQSLHFFENNPAFLPPFPIFQGVLLQEWYGFCPVFRLKMP